MYITLGVPEYTSIVKSYCAQGNTTLYNNYRLKVLDYIDDFLSSIDRENISLIIDRTAVRNYDFCVPVCNHLFEYGIHCINIVSDERTFVRMTNIHNHIKDADIILRDAIRIRSDEDSKHLGEILYKHIFKLNTIPFALLCMEIEYILNRLPIYKYDGIIVFDTGIYDDIVREEIHIPERMNNTESMIYYTLYNYITEELKYDNN